MENELTMAELQTETVEDVEIARVGVWQSSNAGAVPITEQDLDDMVAAYKATADEYPVPLKIGHTMRQQVFGDLAQELGDGEPAFGWVAALRREGDRLLATFTDVPAKLVEFMKAKSWRNRSPEVRFNATVGNRRYPRMLQAVALLGALSATRWRRAWRPTWPPWTGSQGTSRVKPFSGPYREGGAPALGGIGIPCGTRPKSSHPTMRTSSQMKPSALNVGMSLTHRLVPRSSK